MKLFNENIEKSIGFVTKNKFSSDQHNDRFKDLIANRTIEDIEFEVKDKGSMFEVYLVGGIMVDHRGIRYNFFESTAPKVIFKKNLDNKKYVRFSVFYDKSIPRNFEIELKAYMIDNLKSTVGTHLGGDERIFTVGTFEVSGGKLKLVDRPYYHGEPVQIQIKEIHERIDKEVNTLNNTINTKEKNLNNRINKEVSSLNSRIDKEVNNMENYVDNEINTLEQKVDNNKRDCENKIGDLQNNASDSVDCLQNSIDTLAGSINSQLVDLGITVTTGPHCSMDGGGGGSSPVEPDPEPTPPPILRRNRVGMKRSSKGEESTFEKVETYDQNNKILTRSILSDFRDGLYRKRTVTMNMGTPTQTTYTLELIYDSDGDLIEERKV